MDVFIGRFAYKEGAEIDVSKKNCKKVV